MTNFTDLVREVRSTLRGYGLVKDAVTFLNGAITDTALSIVVDDATQLQPGVVEIGDECIYVQSIDTGTNTLTVSPDGRGWDGTTAAAHADNARVTADPPYPTHRIESAINDTIVGTWPTLFGVGASSFTYNPSVTTYSVDTAAESVLSVTTTVLGPSKDQVEINRYTFNSNAPASEFASGNCITLGQVPEPGRTVTVNYTKAPSALTTGDEFTASGLRETAKRCIVYGAVAQLISYVDATKALTNSAVAKAFGDDVRIGSATQLAAQLTARHQMELEAEQRRLLTTHKPRVRIGGR